MAESLAESDVAFIRGLVIHQDPEFIVLAKPPGLSSQGGRIGTLTLDNLLAAFAKPSGVKPRLIHRLDRDTSGVILCARSKPAAAFLGRAMMTRRIQKTYLAIVAPGAPVPEAGEIALPLARREIGREAHVQVVAPGAPGAQSAVTRYRTLKVGPESALVELSPRTGRMHQLRVHMASIGSPILGDARYGGQLVLAGQTVPRLMLHALSLRFPHPSGGWMRVEAPPPSDFQSLADAVSK